MRMLALICLVLPGCGDLAWNTRVAESMAVRAAMVDSVQIGVTTQTEFTTRWGHPVQKIREGRQVEFIYRDMWDAEKGKLYSVGDSSRFVIVTFQYGRAVAVRTNDDEACRATFSPRPPGHGFDNFLTVYPVPACPGLYRPDPNVSVPEGAAHPDLEEVEGLVAAKAPTFDAGTVWIAGGTGALGMAASDAFNTASRRLPTASLP